MVAHFLWITTVLGGSPWIEGTIFILKDSNAVVESMTDSRITHVAILFDEGTKSYVYEATPAKVRRVLVSDYLQEISRLNTRRGKPIQVLAIKPTRSYTGLQLGKMRTFVKQELGRKYSVKSYVRDRPAEGVHCSEFASNVLNASKCYTFRQPHRTTPVRFVTALSASYDAPTAVNVPTRSASWCRQTADCWNDFWGWCGWACVETWNFCY